MHTSAIILVTDTGVILMNLKNSLIDDLILINTINQKRLVSILAFYLSIEFSSYCKWKYVDEVHIPVGGLLDEENEHIIDDDYHGEIWWRLIHELKADDILDPVINPNNQNIEVG